MSKQFPAGSQLSVLANIRNRRQWCTAGSLALLGSLMPSRRAAAVADPRPPAQVAITLDLEMARNFPQWEDTHWDYEKGNLDAATKAYAVKAGELVRSRGGRIHYFCVGSALEQADVGWLARLASDGHPIGNHTYDHVYLLAATPAQVQYRFQRAPWLIADQPLPEILRHNIRLTTQALKERLNIDERGFRTPGGFAEGLRGREDLQHMLLDLGFTWVSSRYPSHLNSDPGQQPSDAVYDSIVAAQSQAQPFIYPTGLVEIPMSPISDIGAFRNGRWELDWFLQAIRRAMAWVIEQGGVFDFLGHPSCLGVVDPDCQLQADLPTGEQSAGRAVLADLDQIAAPLPPPPA